MTAGQVKEWASSNGFFEGRMSADGSDLYIGNNPLSYPHIHIGSNFVVLSSRRGSHRKLIDGDRTYTQVAREIFEDRGLGDAHIAQVCRYIHSQG